MIKRKNPNNGIKIYKSAEKVSDTTTIQKCLLAVIHMAAVWMVMAACWEGLASVFPSPVQTQILYIIFIFPAVISAIVCRTRRKWLWAALYLIVVACLLWLVRDILPNVINYLEDSYLFKENPYAVLPKRGAEELLNNIGRAGVDIYHIEPIGEWQMAYVTGLLLSPVFLILSAVLHRKRGKWISLIIMIIPFTLPAQAGYMPSLMSGWMVVLAGGFYFAICGCISGKGAFIRGMAALAVLGTIAAAATIAGTPLEKHKATEDGIYRKTHNFINKTAAFRMQDTWKNDEENTEQDEKETASPTSDAREEERKNTGHTFDFAEETEEPYEAPDGKYRPENDYNVTANLNLLERYLPDYEKRTVVVSETKPTRTMYYPNYYGGKYKRGVWRQTAENSDIDIFCGYDNLEMLSRLCEPYVGKPIPDVSNFIDKEFKENTVYDYEPGKTPKDWDFSEYFLFVNKKGFCVHFATTATLMYRICGYPARYVQGYAVPADAFEKHEDGTYVAVVTGAMGHAWCEVYDNEKGWVLKEHTLTYMGEHPANVSPAANVDTEKQDRLNIIRPWLTAAAVALSVVAAMLAATLFFGIRAMIVKKRRLRTFITAKNGIVNAYAGIYEMGVFLGIDKEYPLSRRGYENIEAVCPKEYRDELGWLYRLSMETMFYDKTADISERKRAAELYRSLSRKMAPSGRGWKHFRYRYIKCF